MKYPTLEQVNVADHAQLATWHRFLPSPGSNERNAKFELVDGWEATTEREFETLKLICARLKEAGGWNLELSKQIGWQKPVE